MTQDFWNPHLHVGILHQLLHLHIIKEYPLHSSHQTDFLYIYSFPYTYKFIYQYK